MKVDKERLKNTRPPSEYENASSRYIFTPISKAFTQIFVRTNLTPNQITVIWGVLMILSSIAFFFGEYWLNVLGGIGWVIGYALDYTDGDIARYRNMRSARGGFLDLVNHRTTYPLMMFGIGFGAWSSGRTEFFGVTIEPASYLVLGFLAGLGMILIMDLGDIFNKVCPDNKLNSDKGSAAVEGGRAKNKKAFRIFMNLNPLTFTNMMLLIPVFAAIGYPEVFIIFYGVFYPVAAVFRYVTLYRMVPGVNEADR